MSTDNGRAAPIHIPVPLGPDEDLSERTLEIINIVASTVLTDQDRASPWYKRFDGVAGPSTEWEDREEYLARCFLSQEGRRLMAWAIDSGIALVVADLPGRGHSRLDHRIFFGPNKWDHHTIQTGRYAPMNTAHDEGGKWREQVSGFPLWIRNEDWDSARAQIIAQRERLSGARLAPDFHSLLGSNQAFPTKGGTAQAERFGDTVWARHNPIWIRGAPARWPDRDGLAVFLGSAVLQLGRAKYGSLWKDDIPARPRPSRDGLETAQNRSGTELEAFVNERPVREQAERRRLWPMFDDVVQTIIEAAKSGDLRCYVRAADHLDLVELGPKRWRLPDSIWVFQNCRMDPDRPFAREPKFGTAQSVFVHAGDLEKLISPARPIAADDMMSAPMRDATRSDPQPIAGRMLDKKDSEAWYHARIAQFGNATPPSRDDDVIAGRQAGLTAQRVRELRNLFAPSEWTRKGRRPIP